ncbi:MAG: aminoglycoside adenylyltransferase domain-containing protein, partial [Chloroflexota bacterium]
DDAKSILGRQFVGMYLYGSLATGDFNPENSDIDFLVVTTGPLEGKTISELEVMHNQVWATSLKRAGKLEGAYVHRDLIRKHGSDGLPCPGVNEGKFFVAPLDSDWIIQRHVVREYGVVVEGPDPKTLIDFVRPDDIREAVMAVLKEWWFPMLDEPSWLREHDVGYRSFAVITMCRVLHALAHGTIVSKPKAAAWAYARVDGEWKDLIDRAIAVSNHETRDITLEETLHFMEYTKQRIERETA